MKRYLKWLVMFTMPLVILLILPALLHAQIDPSGDPDAPIDGGLGVLIAIGVGYGLKKMRSAKKEKNHDLKS